MNIFHSCDGTDNSFGERWNVEHSIFNLMKISLCHRTQNHSLFVYHRIYKSIYYHVCFILFRSGRYL